MLIILSLSRKKNPLLASFGSTREIIFCYYSLQDLLLIFFSSSIEPAIRPDLCSKLEKILKCSKHNCNFSYDIRQLEKKLPKCNFSADTTHCATMHAGVIMHILDNKLY